MEVCVDQDIRGREITVNSDSQAAIRAISNPVVTSAVVRDCKETCRAVNGVNTLTLKWVPGHAGIAGNEKADELARTGSNTNPCGPEPILPIPWAGVKMEETKRLSTSRIVKRCAIPKP